MTPEAGAEKRAAAPGSAGVGSTWPTPREALRVWLRVAALSFGGPAGQVAVMERILVEEKRWISRERFLHALGYCMILPGPEAQQLATYCGWLLHGTRGGLIAGGLFILPGFLSILALSLLYASYRDLWWVQGLFAGLGAAVVAIVVQAVVRIGKRALHGRFARMVAAAAFLALLLFAVPFPWVVVVAGLLGWWHGRGRGEAPAPTSLVLPSWRRSVAVLLIGLVVWWGPVLALAAHFGGDHVLVDEALFFGKAAMVTFGGAYAVLAYVAQQAVEHYGWLQPGEMLDGLAMAETTPGPLIQVVQFVGFMGAMREPGGMAPWLAGVWGSLVTTWVTFVPCFVWIFLGAPYIEWLRGARALSAALAAITAAVVGVILQLSVWFALHTWFEAVEPLRWGPIRTLVPGWSSVDPAAVGLTMAALVLVFGARAGMATTLAVAAAVGMLLEVI
jgi:chromate transporter